MSDLSQNTPVFTTRKTAAEAEAAAAHQGH